MKEFINSLFNGYDVTGLLKNVLVAVCVYIIAKIIIGKINKICKNVIAKTDETLPADKKKSILTTVSLINNVLKYVVSFIALASILNIFGLGNILGNILVTAGIGSLAISFGAQAIVQDVVTGVFLLFEKQFEVGDFVKIGEYEGVVTAINLRVTHLNQLGKKVIIPNGKISSVTNYTNDFSQISLTIPTPYESNTREVLEVLKDECENFYKANEDRMLEVPEVLGVSNFNNDSVDILIRGKVKPMKHWEIERELRLAIKERFDKDGISIPYHQVVVHKGE